MRQNQPPPSTTANHQKYALLTVIILCVLPFLLNQLGISFAAYSATSSPEPSSIDHLVHVLLEWSAISIAVIAALASVLHYRCHKNINVPVIGMALASAGLLDAFHLLATTGIIIANTPEHQFIPFTWALTRIFAALAMTLAGAAMLWTAHQAKLQQTESHQSKIHHSRLLIRFSLIFLALTSGAIHLTLGNGALPQTIYPQAFLTRPFDVLPFALFLFSGTLFWLWYQQLKSPLRLALLLSLIPQMVAQLHMVFGHENGLDNSSNIAHGLKILAYGCILIGILLELMKKTDQTTTANTLAPAHLTMLSEQDNQDFLETGKATQPLAIQLPVAAFILAISVTFIVSFTFYLESAQLIKKQEVSQLRIEGELV
ncbi:MAG: two-component system sensor histidine kinase/response regulator, partial [Phenylobacterium sp.]